MEQIKTNTCALLITGTIMPNSNFVTHTNIEQRRQEYIDAIKYYASQFSGNDIYFIENSSYDFNNDEQFLKLFKEKKIILLKFPVSNNFLEGKGYQEFEMLDQTVEKLASKYNHFIKITGRYKVLNLKELICVNCDNMIADSHRKHKVTQTNVFYFSSQFYLNNLKGLYLKANDSEGKFIEHVVYEQLISKNLLQRINLFHKNPIITGFSGSYGGTLHRNKYKMILRNIERKVLSILGVHEFLIEY